MLRALLLFPVLLLFPDPSDPPLRVDNPNHDWGEHYIGHTVRHTFVIENTSQDPITIQKREGSAGATAQLRRTRILPGHKKEVPVRFVTGASQTEGPTRARVVLTTNAAEQPEIVLTLSGHLQKLMVASLTSINLVGPTGQQLRGGFTATSREPGLTVLGVTSKNPQLIVESYKRAGADSWAVKLSTTAANTTRTASTQVVFEVETKDGTRHQIPFPVRIQRRSPFRLFPARVTLPAGASKERTSYLLLERRHPGCRIEKVELRELRESEFDVEIWTHVPGREWRIVIRRTGGLVKARGEIRLHTDDPSIPWIDIPVVAGSSS